MRRILLISSLGTAAAAAAAGACTDGNDATCSTQGAALLQHRSNLARSSRLSEDNEIQLMMAQARKRSLAAQMASISADKLLMSEVTSLLGGADCNKCAFCIVDGECHATDPTGAATTEAVCKKYQGTWCPSGATPPKQEPAVPPCISADDFKATAMLGGTCDLKGKTPDDVTCAVNGCHLEDVGGKKACVCHEKVPCEKIGGSFAAATCRQALDKCGAACKVFKEAKDKGTCDNVNFPGGPPLKMMVKQIAMHCCKSFPKDLCNANGKITTPCADDADFTPDEIMSGDCQFAAAAPSPMACSAEGCFPDPAGGCYCPTEQPCKKLGGTFVARTCGVIAASWQEATASIEEIKKKNSCDGVQINGEPADLTIKHYAKKCCKTSPKSVCNPTGKIETPCKDNTDFTPKATLYAHCETVGTTEDDCKSSGCRFDATASMCFCDNEAKCDKAKGAWRSQTCGGYVDFMEAAPIRKARKAGSCDGIKTSYDMDLSVEVAFPASMCCNSKPSICDA